MSGYFSRPRNASVRTLSSLPLVVILYHSGMRTLQPGFRQVSLDFVELDPMLSGVHTSFDAVTQASQPKS